MNIINKIINRHKIKKLEGEMLCDKCKGKGFFSGKICPKCMGDGKVDWISNITGVSKPPSNNKGFLMGEVGPEIIHATQIIGIDKEA